MSIEILTQKAGTIAGEVIRKEISEIEKGRGWFQETMKALQQAGFGGLVVSKKYGGLGHGMFALAKICEELGKESGSAALCYGMHCVAAAVVNAKATDFQRRNFLQPICEGGHITTLALSEPGAGVHFYFPQTRLSSLSEKEFIINGEKSFVTNGGYADSYVISTMAAEEGAPPDHFSCAIIPAEAKNLVWGDEWRGFGMWGNASRNLQLNGVKIPSTYILGEQGDQLWYFFNIIAPYFLTAMSGAYLGIAQRALNEAIGYLKTRTYAFSGSALSESIILQHRIGALFAMVESVRRLIYHAAWEGDQGTENAIPPILAAKAEVAKMAVEVVNESMTICGGKGYAENGILARLLRDVRAAHVMAPPTDMLYEWIGRYFLDQPLLMND